jgi:hypothetical protein
LALPSPEQIANLPEFNLVAGLIAFDGDAKASSLAAPYKVPAHISDYVRSVQSYSEISPSLMGLRALAFGTIPTEHQNITKRFGDGTELGLYRGGWVTLSGLPLANSSSTIEHRQQAIDRIVAELWSDLNGGTCAANEPVSAAVMPVREGEDFILDWSRSVSQSCIHEFIDGKNRTHEQTRKIIDTWELTRGWTHGGTPDSSMYTKRIVYEALWLKTHFRWTLQDVADLVITFCRKHGLPWSFGRAKKQIADGLAYISSRTCQKARGFFVDFDSHVFEKTPPTPLTCIGSQINQEQNRLAEAPLTDRLVNDLRKGIHPKSPDSLQVSYRLEDGRNCPGASGINQRSATPFFKPSPDIRDGLRPRPLHPKRL